MSQAKLIHQVKPEYPPIAKKAGVSGMVIVSAIIETDGSVGRTEVLRSVPMLDAAALDAVRQWAVRAGVQDGRPVRMRLTVTVQFNVQ